jgi:hypothetical protein
MVENCSKCDKKFNYDDPKRIDIFEWAVWDRDKRLQNRYHVEMCKSCFQKVEDVLGRGRHLYVAQKPENERCKKTGVVLADGFTELDELDE